MPIRPDVVLLVVGITLSSVACGSEEPRRLSAVETTPKLQDACADYAATCLASIHPVAGDSFVGDSYDPPAILASEVVHLMDGIRGPKETEADIVAPYEDIVALQSNWSAIVAAVASRELAAIPGLLAQSPALIASATLANDLGLTNCTTETWYGDWHEQAKAE